MKQPEKFYDVYVSYPPGVDRERVNACIYDNLPENEATDLVNSLVERAQVIIAENCTLDERENAHQYFSYLGLDVIIRHSMALTEEEKPDDKEALSAASNNLHQCPVCNTIIENLDDTECKVCHFHFAGTNAQTINRKRIEWQEKLAFEHKRQAEIEHMLRLEKEQEEKRLRKQIRAELEEKLQEELGHNPNMLAIKTAKRQKLIIGTLVAFGMIALIAIGYLAAKFL
ncbi:hypothetical protein [Neisseria chenwenguii]|uniref:Uncharacterized protein n=1 Tax=Neisseria chenwenguii TaxID=1853278 RepID=A0A220S3P9_9NEIS|nr:hypothetical protein [Neisseria chenwenguii]ASK27835.1 hypothetical protein BG910_08870 [Neisseria chenwenguii]ROV56627.1 hypothetical protein EGS38_04465 [Neisseria chenwenguii]